MSLEKFDEATPIAGGVLVVAGDGTGYKNGPVGSLKGSRVDTLVAASTDTVDRFMRVFLHNTDYWCVGGVTIPAGAGQGAVPTVDVLASLATSLQAGIAFPYGTTLVVAMDTAVSADKGIALAWVGGDF